MKAKEKNWEKKGYWIGFQYSSQRFWLLWSKLGFRMDEEGWKWHFNHCIAGVAFI